MEAHHSIFLKGRKKLTKALLKNGYNQHLQGIKISARVITFAMKFKAIP